MQNGKRNKQIQNVPHNGTKFYIVKMLQKTGKTVKKMLLFRQNMLE